MSEIRFYHLQKSSIEAALPKILEKALAAGKRVFIKLGDEARLSDLNNALWTYAPDSFLPHGLSSEDHAQKQPVLISAKNDNLNQADMLVLLYGADHPDIGSFSLCCEIFEHHDDAGRAAARQKWKQYKESGHSVTYWQQTEKGGWEQKA